MKHARNIAAILALVGTVVLLWRLHVVRGELAEAETALLAEGMEHTRTSGTLETCTLDLEDTREFLKEREEMCKDCAALYTRNNEMLFRCEEKICADGWVPYEQYSSCTNALWDVDPAAVERLEAEELEATRKLNDRAAIADAAGIIFVPLSQYDRCVGLLQTCDDRSVAGSLVDELTKRESGR